MHPRFVRPAALAALASVLAAPRPSSLASTAPDPTPPNILLIVLDDVGIDKLAMYGKTPGPYVSVPYECVPDPDAPYEYAPTPNLERLANGEVLANGQPIGGGIRFAHCYANPVCSPTRACLMTGRYAFRTGVGFITDSLTNPWEVQDDEKFLAEILKDGLPESPYASGAFGKWHMTTPIGHDTHAVEHGFDVFKGHMRNVSNHYSYRKVTSTAGTPPTVTYTAINGTLDPVTQEFTPSANPTYDYRNWNGHIATGDAKNWINAQTEPFFAYVCYSPPHTPYQVPPFNRLSAATQAELSNAGNCGGGAYSAGMRSSDFQVAGDALQNVFYRAMLEAVDTEIGRLIDGIDSEKLANTMIFVIGDNGTPFTVIDPGHNAGHGKGSVYEWGTHVPLIVCGPLVDSAGANVCSGLVEAVDLWRTIAEITGASEAATDPLDPLDSISFYPMIDDPQSDGDRDLVFCQYFTPNGRYEATTVGPYETTCGVPVPDDDCVMVELGSHIRSVTDGEYRYVRKQFEGPDDGSPQGEPDTPPTYTEELYNLLYDPEETDNLIPPTCQPPCQLLNPALQARLDNMRNYMLGLSGY